jgi:hypothetical protein
VESREVVSELVLWYDGRMINLTDVDADIHPTQYVSDHEVLLSFTDDEHAAVFRDWLQSSWADFQEYAEAQL